MRTHTHMYICTHTHTHDSALTTFLAPLTPWIVLLMRLSRAWAVYYTMATEYCNSMECRKESQTDHRNSESQEFELQEGIRNRT